ncbi:MAG: TolC family protein [Cyanobacteriota bacterium]|nr:TolC family protein [Cyanobacteriota bacterium]
MEDPPLIRAAARVWRLGVVAALLLPLAPPGGDPPAAQAAPRPLERSTERLEKSWRELDRELQVLDSLLPKEQETRPDLLQPAPPLPATLLRANEPASGPLDPTRTIAPPPLSLPQQSQLQGGGVQSLSLEQALAIAFAANPGLQARRNEVAAALASLQAALGTYWPRLEALAAGFTGQSRTNLNAPVGNGALGLGPLFEPGGAFFVPSGGAVSFNTSSSGGFGGLQLGYDLLDFARTPTVRAARARLDAERQAYANDLRQLQLQVSEAYFQLQQADQNVRIQDAAVRNDLVILQDALDLKKAGLVPRLDVLRRQAIEAANQETLIQALADRAIARRQLALLLNLPADLTPAAGDPVVVLARWPLDLETSLMRAYRGNPALDVLLATREALVQERQAALAALLPRLALVAQAGANASTVNTFDLQLRNGGCCGTTVVPVQNSSGADWSVALTLQWLLFDAGTTRAQGRALEQRAAAIAQRYASERDTIRLRLESAFFNHEASLARLASARRGVAASLEGFRDVRLRYKTGLSNEVEVSLTQERLIASLVQRLNATVAVNLTYARLLRELLTTPNDPNLPVQPQLQLPSPQGVRDDHQRSMR